MGAADFNTGALIKGTQEEILAALKIFNKYVTTKHEQYAKERNCAYLMSCYVSYDGEQGMGTRLTNMSEEDLIKFIEEHDNKVLVSASGPYGRFGSLSDVDLFKEIAEAAPHATVSGGMSGFNPGGDQIAAFELENGLMKCKYHEGEQEWDEDEDGEDWDDEWDEEDFEEPDWDYEEVYDPIAKKIVK